MGPLGPLLQLLGARFADPALEGQYRLFRASEYFIKDDGFQAVMRAVLLGCIAVRALSVSGLTISNVALLGIMAGPLAQIMMKAGVDRQCGDGAALANYLRRRTAMGLFWRLMIVPIAVKMWFSYWFKPTGSSPTTLQLLLYIFFGSGVLPVTWLSVATPLFLEHHLAVQAPATLLLAGIRQVDFCREVVELDGGVDHMLGIWRRLDTASLRVLSAMFSLDLKREWEPEALPACLHTVQILYAMLCFVASTYILWRVEHRSRIHFLATRGLARQAGPRWQPVEGVSKVLHSVFVTVLFAVVWQALAAPPGGTAAL